MSFYQWDKSIDGEFSKLAFRSKLEKKGYSVYEYTYPPGTYFPDHTHGVDKIDGVVSGKFRITTPNGEMVLKKGDYLEVPKGMVHSAEVVGEESVVSLDAIREG